MLMFNSVCPFARQTRSPAVHFSALCKCIFLLLEAFRYLTSIYASRTPFPFIARVICSKGTCDNLLKKFLYFIVSLAVLSQLQSFDLSVDEHSGTPH